jgi:hypothetical protein
MRNGRAQTVEFQVNRSRKGSSTLFELALVLSLTFQLFLLNGCAGYVSGAGKQTTTQAAFQLSPASVNFGQVPVGKVSTQSISISNIGSTALNITGIKLSNTQFSVTGMTTPMALGVGQSGSFSVTVNPTSAGSLSGTLTAQGDSSSAPVVVSLTATAVSSQPQLSVSPASIGFGSVSTGLKGSANLSLTNLGTADLTISSISMTGTEFTLGGIAAPKVISSGQTAQATVTFSPTAAGSATGSISIASNDPVNPTVNIPLSGTGSSAAQAGLAITPSSASFGNVTIGSPSTQTIQLTNSGTATLTITQISASGGGFSIGTLTFPISLNPGQSTTFNVQFAPASAGAASGTVSILSNAPNSPATIALSGSGVVATQVLSFSTTNVGFGNVDTGLSSTQNILVTNTGNANVSISQIAETGPEFSLSGAGAPVTLTPGQSLTFGVTFAPNAVGSASGTVNVTSNATGSPATIVLSGAGITATSHSVALNWNASTSTVSGYNVYRSTTSGTGYTKINASLVSGLTYTDSSVVNATTYYYVTTAVDSSGNESTYSNQATASVP